MAKDDKKNAKNTKTEAKPETNKEANKEAQKTDWKEQTKPDNNGTPNGGCSTIAKVLIYLIPLALYVPWAYRMFKGNACCSEVPKCPTALSQGCPSSGNTSISAPLSRLGHRFKAPPEQSGTAPPPSCSEYVDNKQQQPQQEMESGKAKPVDVDKERGECLDQSKQCLEKCMEKCFDADRVEKKKKKKKKEKERKYDEEEDDD